MIKIDKTEVYGWDSAIRGMRNPFDSWCKSDTVGNEIGEADLNLMSRLIHSGDDHGKCARMLIVTTDIEAPFYWWKEFDTYKVGTVADSCSTMHTIANREFTLDDFSCEHLDTASLELLKNVISHLNIYRLLYLDGKKEDKSIWWQIIQLLPTSYNQLRTVQLNYQVIRHMYYARKNHKLDEWLTFCSWIESLPHFEELIK